MTRLDGLHEVVRGVINSLQDIGIALSIGSPLHDHFVEAVGRLELTTQLSAIERFFHGVMFTDRMSLRICSTWAMEAFVPSMTLSARSS